MMPRIFLETPVVIGDTVVVAGEAAHHYVRVLRVSPGEEVPIASDGRGYRTVIEAVDKSTLTLRVLEQFAPHEATAAVIVVQGLAKGDKLDTIIQKCTEVGAAGFVLLQSNRSVVRLDAKKSNDKEARWRKVAEQAASQAQRDVIPFVEVAASVDDVRERLTARGVDLVVVCDEDEMSVSLRAAVRRRARPDGQHRTIAVAIGPEGGWDDEEREHWKLTIGAVMVTLGPRILRTETAGLVAVSALLYESGDLGGDNE